MKFRDDRTPEEKKTHSFIVMGTDKFLSNLERMWGEAKGGPSYIGWSCKMEHITRVDRWVRNRSDMQRVRIVGGNYRPPSGPGHCHIYVVDENHPALK